MTENSPTTDVHDELDREAEGADALGEARFEDPEAEAAFWRDQFERERGRLAKLWVAYQDLKAELEARAEPTARQAAADALAETTREPESTAEPSNGDGTATTAEAASEPATVEDEPPEPAPGEDPFGDIHPVEDVEGIGEVYDERLDEIGVRDTRRLWAADAETVAEAVGAAPGTVRRWQRQAELMAVDGVGPQFAELLARSGVDTIADLADADADQLLERLEAKEESLDVAIQKGRLTEDRVEDWIAWAREHAP